MIGPSAEGAAGDEERSDSGAARYSLIHCVSDTDNTETLREKGRRGREREGRESVRGGEVRREIRAYMNTWEKKGKRRKKEALQMSRRRRVWSAGVYFITLTNRGVSPHRSRLHVVRRTSLPRNTTVLLPLCVFGLSIALSSCVSVCVCVSLSWFLLITICGR